MWSAPCTAATGSINKLWKKDEKGLRLLRSAKRLAFGIAGTFRRRTLNRRHPMLLRTVA